MPANDYYDSTGAPSTSSTISSSTLRAEFDAIETGFTAVQTALALKAGLASPTLVTPNLGTPSAGVLTNTTGLPLTTGVTGTLPVANGGTGVTTSTGSGNTVLSTSPTLVTPLLGTPTSGVATNLTGLPLTTGVTGTLPVANGGTGVTTSTGSGNVVLSTSPTLVTPILGTPTSGVATNLTGTAAGLTAGNVTTNANLTGPVTSVGNATAIADAALSIAKTSGLQTALDAKAPIASPTFTGSVTASGGVLVTGGTTAQKAIIFDATKGLQIRGGTGSANDFVLDNAAGDSLIANPAGTRHLNAGGSFGRGIPVTKTTNFTVGANENWITCVGTGTITVTLPSAASYQGREIMIKNLAAFTVVSASSNVEPLNSGTPGTAILPATAGKWVTLVSNGVTWVIEQGNT